MLVLFGPTSRASMSAGAVCDRLFRVTEMCVTTPTRPEAVMVDGYTLAVPAPDGSPGIRIEVAFVCVNVAGTTRSSRNTGANFTRQDLGWVVFLAAVRRVCRFHHCLMGVLLTRVGLVGAVAGRGGRRWVSSVTRAIRASGRAGAAAPPPAMNSVACEIDESLRECLPTL